MSRSSRFALVVLGLWVLGCSTDFGPDEPRDIAEVKINMNAGSRGVYGYTPNPLTVIDRTQVIWTNMDTVPHQIESSGGFFSSSGLIEPNQSYNFVFKRVGNYRYFCAIRGHREEGTINVTP